MRGPAFVVVGSLVLSGVFAGVAPAGTTSQGWPVVLGGKTSQGWPVVLELSKDGKKVTDLSAGLHLTCTSGSVVNLPDGYVKMSIKGGKFSASFGPETQKNDDGTTTIFTGSVSGKLNKARSKASGTWTFTGEDHDAAGALKDTCNSGTVRWSAKQ